MLPLLEQVETATRRLLETVRGFGTNEMTEPSLLPGWTRAHVLTHLARNADGHVRMLDGALVGELREQYASREARTEAIETGAQRPAPVIVDDLLRACSAWRAAADAMPPDAWDAPVQPLGRAARPAHRLLWARLREVEVHHVDLACATYGIADWPSDFAAQLLEEISATFEARGERPCLRLVAIDTNLARTTGRPQTLEVRGPVRSLAGWLAGRHGGHDLNTNDESALPVPPHWA